MKAVGRKFYRFFLVFLEYFLLRKWLKTIYNPAQQRLGETIKIPICALKRQH